MILYSVRCVYSQPLIKCNSLWMHELIGSWASAAIMASCVPGFHTRVVRRPVLHPSPMQYSPQRLAAVTLVSCPCRCMLTSVLDSLQTSMACSLA